MNNRIVQGAIGLTLAALLGAALAGCSSDNNELPSPSVSSSSQAVASSPTASATASASATADSTPTPAVESPGLPLAPGQEVLDAFQDMIASGAAAAELNAQLDADLPKTAPETADELIRELLGYYNDHVQDTLLELQQGDLEQFLELWPFTEDEIPKLQNERIRQAAQEAFDGGYKLETSEGMIFTVVDYGKLKRFNDALSPAMRDYIALLALESDQKPASDAALVISWEETGNRALAAEKFIRDYPDSKEKDDAGRYYLRYMSYLLTGLSNTPIWDDSLQLKADVKTEYEKLAAEQPDTLTGSMVQSFLDIMAETNDRMFKTGPGGETDIPEVKAFWDGMESRILEELGIANPNK
ncbi:hypothetical protein COLU111180_00100 [Cohnella lubricantis]|uniref:Lipoprotein n=1 Tax=Cohnella lubricantis TaxID=2163172 RepID=A0A841TCP8_9BACL|nr:hypothetical protein [Cohnella lubricantis]MBB6677138.1 hypothetical protein [Cohnella lubricantis]MBP2118986.1 hypothetical protein [Cohnella lubricantis]